MWRLAGVPMSGQEGGLAAPIDPDELIDRWTLLPDD